MVKTQSRDFKDYDILVGRKGSDLSMTEDFVTKVSPMYRKSWANVLFTYISYNTLFTLSRESSQAFLLFQNRGMVYVHSIFLKSYSKQDMMGMFGLPFCLPTIPFCILLCIWLASSSNHFDLRTIFFV